MATVRRQVVVHIACKYRGDVVKMLKQIRGVIPRTVHSIPNSEGINATIEGKSEKSLQAILNAIEHIKTIDRVTTV